MSFAAGQRAVFIAAGFLKEAVEEQGFAGKYVLPVGMTAALELGNALPMIGYTHHAYKRLQERVPEAYRPAALTGGAIGAIGLGAGGGLAGHIAMQLLSQRIKGLKRFTKHPVGAILPRGLGTIAGGIAGHELGERAGVAAARELDPNIMSELKFKLGI